MIYVYNMNKERRGSGIFTSVISIIFGALICLLSAFAFDAMVDIVFTIIGLGIIITNVLPLMMSIQAIKVDQRYIIDLIFSIISIILGVMFIFNHSATISIICGVFLVIIPIVRIILAKEKLLELKRQLPLFIVALLMFFNVASVVLRVALIVIGAILALLGIINLVMELIYSYKHKDDNDSFDDNNPFNSHDGGNGTIGGETNHDNVVIDAEFKEL